MGVVLELDRSSPIVEGIVSQQTQRAERKINIFDELIHHSFRNFESSFHKLVLIVSGFVTNFAGAHILEP